MRIYDDVAVNECGTTSPTSTLTTELCASSPSSSTGTQYPIYENVVNLSPRSRSSVSASALIAKKSTSSSSSSSSSPFCESTRLNMDFINNIPPPPIVNYEKMDGSTLDYGPSRRQNQPLDMRPLSMPANERKRLERGSSCIVSMIIIGIVVSMILFTLIVWYYYDDIMEQLRNLKDFF